MCRKGKATGRWREAHLGGLEWNRNCLGNGHLGEAASSAGSVRAIIEQLPGDSRLPTARYKNKLPFCELGQIRELTVLLSSSKGKKKRARNEKVG